MSSDPLHSTVFGDSNISSKVASSGLADSFNRNLPPAHVTTQLHTPLPRPGGVSGPSTSSTSSSSSMEAVNRSRSTVDPLASTNVADNLDFPDEDSRHAVLPEEQITPLDMYITQFQSKICSPPIDVSLISHNISGLHILASCNAWRHVVNMSTELMEGKPESAFSDDQCLSVVFIFRMVGLFRLKMLDELQEETNKILAIEESKILTQMTGENSVVNPDKGGDGLFLSYPLHTKLDYRIDNIVSLQLLSVEVKVITGHSDEALNMMYMLRQWLSSHDGDISFESRVTIWRWKVVWSLINVLLRQRLWRQGIKEMISILDDVETMTEKLKKNDNFKLFDSKFRCVEVIILCRISRTLMQMGALQSAKCYLNKARTIYEAHTKSCEPNSVLETHIDVTQGLLCFSNDEFPEACELFKNVIDSAINSRSMGSTNNLFQSESRESGEGSTLALSKNMNILSHSCAGITEMEESLLPIAVNNFAVCSLHLRRIKVAVLKIEELVQDDPTRHMIDPVIFNLCTMYDLSFGPDVSSNKKKALKAIAEKYNIDDLSWRSFRL